MKHLKKMVWIIATFLLPLTAEEVMKITLTGSVSEEKLSTFSKIVFTDDAMITGASYTLNEIQKIEFYDDGNSAIADNFNSKQSKSLFSQEQIGFLVTSSTLSLTLPKVTKLSVSLFSLNGRKVAELFNGYSGTKILNLSLSKVNLATGLYSVMIKTDNSVYVRKLIIK